MNEELSTLEQCNYTAEVYLMMAQVMDEDYPELAMVYALKAEMAMTTAKLVYYGVYDTAA